MFRVVEMLIREGGYMDCFCFGIVLAVVCCVVFSEALTAACRGFRLAVTLSEPRAECSREYFYEDVVECWH